MDYVGQVLRSLGIRRQDRVAVVLPNGPEMAAAFLGIAAYSVCAPLNPAYRRGEFDVLLQDLQASAIAVPAGADLAAREVAQDLGLILIELQPGQCAGCFRMRGVPTDFPSPADWGEPEDIALFLHTSGTTSRPKLVPLSHRNLCYSARNVATVLNLREQDCCLNVMPLFHIHGLVGALLSSLLAGGSVVCSAGFDSRRFAGLMRDFQPTWYSAVPAIHQSVLALAKSDPAVAASGRLRLIRSSSAALPPAVMAELEATFGVPVIESYGMTEAAHQMASNPLPPRVRKPGSVGLPAGPEMAIVDDAGRPLPAGVTGEIVIRGPNVMAGYLGDDQSNAAAFAGGWLRTGDLGCRDEDGYFYVLARANEVTNRGGEKISPREIDEVLLEHPAVAQAAAFAVPHPTLGEDLAAAVVLHDTGAASESELRRFLFERLAAVKVPSRILIVAEIPHGPSGKPQRIGLHERLAGQLRTDFVPPRSDLEKRIGAVIEQALGANRVSVLDNFFWLGGDSLKAARVLAQLSSVFQVQLPAITLFLNPTVAELSVEITRLLGEDTGFLEDLLDEMKAPLDADASLPVNS
jgi:acyl-CoA synthetase (AMP-forming)/AMP-acid ligase II